MSTSFNAVDATLTTTYTTPVYTCPSSPVLASIIFAGTISNIDVSTAEYNVTLDVQKADGSTFISILRDIPIPYGSSLTMPKLALLPGEKIYAKTTANNKLQIRLSIVERT